jgi:c-di-GMP-binding flagellar brake protein YcgR
MPDEIESSNSNIIFERRRFVRVGGTFVVSYCDVSGAESRSDITQTKNISAGGIMFTTDREFPAGTILRVRLRLPDALDYINVKIQVVGSNKKGKGFLYDTRGKFIGIKEEDREAIKKIVEHNLGHR